MKAITRVPDRAGRWLSGLLLTIGLCWWPLQAQTNLSAARAAMDDPGNPLLLMSTSRGDVYMELFPDAAPQSVDWFLSLALGNDRDSGPYYDRLSFDRVVPGTLIQTGIRAGSGDGLQPPLRIAQEINADALGLSAQPAVGADGSLHPWLNLRNRSEFEQLVLVPLYQQMGIDGPQSLERQAQAVSDRLRQSTLHEIYQRFGYRYERGLPSRPPVAGSVVLAASEPGQSGPAFFITLQDSPWLRGRHTVIGQVVHGSETTRQISARSMTASTPTQIYQIRLTEDTGNGQTQAF